MTNKYIYNNNLDDVALQQVAQLEEMEGKSYDEPEYGRLELDQRTLEILIDCLEAGEEAYEEDFDALNRIDKILRFLKAND